MDSNFHFALTQLLYSQSVDSEQNLDCASGLLFNGNTGSISDGNQQASSGAVLWIHGHVHDCALAESVLDKPTVPVPGIETGRIRVLDLQGLAFMKGLLLVTRITTRDLFDIVALVNHHSLTYPQLFNWHTTHALGYDWLRSKLRDAQQAKNDPGVQPLTKTIPADFPALKATLLTAMDAYEQDIAAQTFAKRTPSNFR